MKFQEYDNLFNELTPCKRLLEGYFEGTLTCEERDSLAAWLRADRRNRVLFMHLKDGKELKSYHLRRAQIDPVQEYRLLVRRMKPAKLQRRISGFQGYAAAAILVLVVIGNWVIISERRRPSLNDISLSVPVELSHTKAILSTTDGEIYELDGSEPVRNNSKFIYSDSTRQMIYSPNSTSQNHFAQLEVPQGGEFKMVLPDGTKVWLNSESSIRFPGTFENRREVFVRGEIYFEVVKDASKPFIVHAGEMQTEVLGTCFGISAYDNEPIWSTVLAEGSVRVSFRDESVLLKPNRRAIIAIGRLSEEAADIEKELAWIKREFVFKSDRLEDVVRRLERWYPVYFRFTDETLRDYRFTGSVSRDMGIEEILGLIEKMNVVSFSGDGQNIDIGLKN